MDSPTQETLLLAPPLPETDTATPVPLDIEASSPPLLGRTLLSDGGIPLYAQLVSPPLLPPSLSPLPFLMPPPLLDFSFMVFSTPTLRVTPEGLAGLFSNLFHLAVGSNWREQFIRPSQRFSPLRVGVDSHIRLPMCVARSGAILAFRAGRNSVPSWASLRLLRTPPTSLFHPSRPSGYRVGSSARTSAGAPGQTPPAGYRDNLNVRGRHLGATGSRFGALATADGPRQQLPDTGKVSHSSCSPPPESSPATPPV